MGNEKDVPHSDLLEELGIDWGYWADNFGLGGISIPNLTRSALEKMASGDSELENRGEWEYQRILKHQGMKEVRGDGNPIIYAILPQE